MGDNDSGEKTEEPTPHKLREAREKGQVTKSKDLTSSIMILVSFVTLGITGEHIWTKISDSLKLSFEYLNFEWSPALAEGMLHYAVAMFLSAMAPMFIAICVTALIVETVQAGFIFTFSPLEPNFEKLNPIEGFKKIFSMKQYVELVKTVFKLAILVYLILSVIIKNFRLIILADQFTPWQIMSFTGDLVVQIVIRVASFYFIIAILDYFYQRYEFIKSMRMTKKEVKDEYKRLEGDPMIKQRQKDAQREMAQGRQMGAVPQADVVVTNPVHIAVAIAYTPDKMRAPKVVAKGKRLIAEAIKKLATDHTIPIVENVPLAQKLYKEAEVDMEVPPDTYRTVAEILAFVYNLKKKRKRRY